MPGKMLRPAGEEAALENSANVSRKGHMRSWCLRAAEGVRHASAGACHARC